MLTCCRCFVKIQLTYIFVGTCLFVVSYATSRYQYCWGCWLSSGRCSDLRSDGSGPRSGVGSFEGTFRCRLASFCEQCVDGPPLFIFPGGRQDFEHQRTKHRQEVARRSGGHAAWLWWRHCTHAGTRYCTNYCFSIRNLIIEWRSRTDVAVLCWLSTWFQVQDGGEPIKKLSDYLKEAAGSAMSMISSTPPLDYKSTGYEGLCNVSLRGLFVDSADCCHWRKVML